MFYYGERGTGMNCEKCVSRRVCFLQKQIESLAKQATDNPFYLKVDTEAYRTASMLARHSKRIERCYNMEYSLRGVIASNCPFYAGKT